MSVPSLSSIIKCSPCNIISIQLGSKPIVQGSYGGLNTHYIATVTTPDEVFSLKAPQCLLQDMRSSRG